MKHRTGRALALQRLMRGAVAALCGYAAIHHQGGRALGQTGGSTRGLVVTQTAGRKLAVVVGINAYRNSPLRTAVTDGKRMAAALRSMGFQIEELYDQEATGSALTSLLRDRLPRQVHPDDQLLFYFAGHGHTDRPAQVDAMGYLAPVDVSLTDIKGTAVSMSSVTHWLAEGPVSARHVMLVVDACYSGLALPTGAGRSVPEQDLALAASLPATIIMTAGTDGQRAVEDHQGGVFTSAVVDSLTGGGADKNHDGFLTSAEMEAFVTSRVKAQAAKAGRIQEPQMARLGAGEFLFSLNGKPLPSVGVGLSSMTVVGRAQGTDAQKRARTLLLDMREVSVGDYKECVAQGVCTAPSAQQGPLCNYGAPGRTEHPINCVTLEHAHAYCHWRRKRLPTESEWIAAARPNGRAQPWGNDAATCDRIVMNDAAGRGCGAGHTQPVSERPLGRSPHGVLNLVGNVREWTLPSGLGEHAEGFSPHPHDLFPVRGGAWHQGAAAQTPDNVVYMLGADADPFTGFRCATTM